MPESDLIMCTGKLNSHASFIITMVYHSFHAAVQILVLQFGMK